MRKTGLIGGVLAVAMAALSGAALAEYPEKPVSFIVPWPPGDLEDVLTRMIAEEFQKQTGAPAAVVNMAGGGGIVGALEVANAAPDGHTIGSFVLGIPTVKTMGPDAQIARDTFEPVGIFLTYPFLIAAAKADAPYNDAGRNWPTIPRSNDRPAGPFRLWHGTDNADLLRSWRCRNWAATFRGRSGLRRSWIARPSPTAMPM
jgi:hypothetical protein